MIVNNLFDEYDYDDESDAATNENDHNDENVIYMIVIPYFVDFFNHAPLNKMNMELRMKSYEVFLRS